MNSATLSPTFEASKRDAADGRNWTPGGPMSNDSNSWTLRHRFARQRHLWVAFVVVATIVAGVLILIFELADSGDDETGRSAPNALITRDA